MKKGFKFGLTEDVTEVLISSEKVYGELGDLATNVEEFEVDSEDLKRIDSIIEKGTKTKGTMGRLIMNQVSRCLVEESPKEAEISVYVEWIK